MSKLPSVYRFIVLQKHFQDDTSTGPPKTGKMKPFIALAFLLATASANNYGGVTVVRAQQQQAPAVLVVDSSYKPSSSATLLREIIPITSLSQNIRSSQLNDLQFTTGNGIAVADKTEAVARPSTYEDGQGRLVQSPSTLVKSGTISYTSPEGVPINLNYIADENGFRVEGAHLPQPVEKLPEVQQAEQDHLSALREAQAKAATLGSLSISDDQSPALIVRSRPYGSSVPSVARVVQPVVRVDSSYQPSPKQPLHQVVYRQEPTVVRLVAPPPITSIAY